MFLVDGRPIFNIDEIPETHKTIAVSYRPFLKDKRLMVDSGSLDLSTGYDNPNLKASGGQLLPSKNTNFLKQAKDIRNQNNLSSSHRVSLG